MQGGSGAAACGCAGAAALRPVPGRASSAPWGGSSPGSCAGHTATDGAERMRPGYVVCFCGRWGSHTHSVWVGQTRDILSQHV